MMSRLSALWVLAAAILFNFVTVPNTAHAAPPNVLMIVGDDWGWTDFGFMGHKVVRTPNLDWLAKEGALFPNGYVPTSLCRASLATILTGQFAHQHKICCNDPPQGVDRSEMLLFLQNSPTIPRLLKDAGYRSFQTGKFWEGHYRNGGFIDGMTTKGRHGEEGLGIGRQTLKPITDFVEAGKGPWFIWYAPMMPHLPHNPPKRLLEKYQAGGRDLRLATYYAMCEWTDETVGTLLKYLDDHKLAAETLVLFVVDNGWVQAEGPPKQGDQFATRSKNTPYDMGVRTPVILRWPGVVKPEKHADLVSTVDLAPTVLTACGVKVPPAMSGVSLLDAAEGKGPLKRSAVFGEIYLHTAKRLDNPANNLTHRWVHEGDWKLIVPVNAKDGSAELFNLADDPQEKQNLAARKPDMVKHLKDLLEKSWRPDWK
jgi:arylsulfatase A-like enzyme